MAGYFYPRPPRGGRPFECQDVGGNYKISIHVLREEDDPDQVPRAPGNGYFYPRPPRGGRRGYDRSSDDGFIFLSTSSARRTTLRRALLPELQQHFYPRPPRGGRPAAQRRGALCRVFLSTSSARRTTAISQTRRMDMIFLSTSSARRTTVGLQKRGWTGLRFLSTSSARRTTPTSASPPVMTATFLSTSSVRRTTSYIMLCELTATHFYPRPPRGGRPGVLPCSGRQKVFLSTSSARRTTRPPV